MILRLSRPAERQFGLVQVLRGFAASWVVLFHAHAGEHVVQLENSIPTWITNVIVLGENGVAIFFALSGFVIAHSVNGARIDLRYAGRFALRRSIRLDPPYWISIGVVLVFGFVSAVVKSEGFACPSPGQLFAHAFYAQTLAGYQQINVVYWTLCYEVQFYLMFLFAILLAQRGTYSYIASLVIMFGIATVWGTGALPNLHQGMFLDLWHCFFAGVLAYWAIERRWALPALITLAVFLLIVNPSAFTIISIATAFALWASRATGYIYRGLSWPLLLSAGSISYSLYLIHTPVLGASFFVLKRFGLSEYVALPVSITACFVAAALMWLMIERPSISFARRIQLRAGHQQIAQMPDAPNQVTTV